MKFDQAVGGGGACVDNICSDGNGDYVDGEDRVGVDAGGRSQPNPAAGIHLGMSRKNGRGRQVFLDIKCLPIHSFPATDGPPHALINQCGLLSDLEFDFGSVVEGILGHLPDCEVGNLFCDLGAMVRPYKEACPELLNGECPDVFTMRNQTIQLMSFKLGSPGLTVEVASAIGGDSAFDPGRCLALHPDPEALAEALCPLDDGTDCNVSVTAYDNNEDGENDEWDVLAMDVTALMCNRQTGTLLGKDILTFGFDAIKK